MKTKLTDREIALVARMLRIGMAPEKIAEIVKVNASTIMSLVESNIECQSAAKMRANEVVTIVGITQSSECDAHHDYEPTTPVPPVMEEATKAAARGFASISELRRYMAQRYDVTEAQLDGDTRIKRHVCAREAAVCAVRMLWPHLPLLQIGRHFSGRDHTTIRHILKKHKLSGASATIETKRAA